MQYVFFVAIEIITMKLLHGGNMVNYHNNCVLQQSLMQQNNICDNDTYCHERIYESNESIVTKLFTWQLSIFLQNIVRRNIVGCYEGLCVTTSTIIKQLTWQ
jgi:hypothetical protein